MGQGGEVCGHQSGLTRAIPAPRSVTPVSRKAALLGGLGGMHRTQFTKRKIQNLDCFDKVITAFQTVNKRL
jgi:hypothetical protein